MCLLSPFTVTKTQNTNYHQHPLTKHKYQLALKSMISIYKEIDSSFRKDYLRKSKNQQSTNGQVKCRPMTAFAEPVLDMVHL